MKRINFYKKKYEALETFYGWVDQGSEYDIAVEQSNYYNIFADEIDEIILNITIAVRYSRCGRKISNQFEERLKRIIEKYSLIEFENYSLTDDEIAILNEEISEVEALICEK